MSKYALLVGVSEYCTEDFKPLPGATANVDDLLPQLRENETNS